MVTDFKIVYDKIKSEKTVEILENNPIFELVWKEISDKYKDIMIEVHS